MGSTLTNLLYHVVFSTKNRERLITAEIRDELYRYIRGIIKGENAILLEIGGEPDHIHIFLKQKPIHSLSEMMRKIKGGSSKWVNEQKRVLGRFSWQEGFGAFSVSESQVPHVIRYIKDQENHHRTLSFQDEFLALLKRNRIAYDEHYLWN